MLKQYLLEFKSQVVLTIPKEMPIPDASQRYHIAQSTLYRWTRDAELANGSPSPDYTTLQRKSQRLEHILQIIRLSAIIECRCRSG